MEIGVPNITKIKILLIMVAVHTLHRVAKHEKRTVEILLPCKFPGKVQERFLKVVVALSRNFIILQILLPVECNLLCLYLPVLHINLVSTENNGYVLTDPKFPTKKQSNLETPLSQIVKSNSCRLQISSFQSLLTAPAQISMPCGNVLVGQPGSNIKHDNCTLPMDAANRNREVQ